MICPFCKTSVSQSLIDHLAKCGGIRLISQPIYTAMGYSEERRSTFRNWIKNNINFDHLVANGFYFTEDADLVSCFWCDVTIGNWEPDQKIPERHFMASPGCAFALSDLKGQNVCWYCSKTISDKHHDDHCPNQLHYKIEFRADPGKVPRNPEMVKTATRFLSFKKAWPLREPSVRQLVENGLYCTGLGDIAACFYCDVHLGNWGQHEDPVERHVNASLKCKFALFRKRLKDTLLSVDHKAMKVESNRLKTFKSWPNYVAVNRMAEIGFHSLSVKNFVQCAFCKVVVGPWYRDYTPYKIHLRNSRECPFLKGENVGNVPADSTPIHPSMENLMKRLYSFNSCYFKDEVLMFKLAKSGFFSTGEFGITCFWCDFQSKCVDETLSERHAKNYATCIFAKRVHKENPYESLVCKVCLVNKCEVMFEPCKHMSSCTLCSQQLSKCCICRVAIRNTVRVYIS